MQLCHTYFILHCRMQAQVALSTSSDICEVQVSQQMTNNSLVKEICGDYIYREREREWGERERERESTQYA